MVQGLGKFGTRVADREGHKLHPSPLFSEGGRDEGGVFLGILVAPNVAAEVPTYKSAEYEVCGSVRVRFGMIID